MSDARTGVRGLALCVALTVGIAAAFTAATASAAAAQTVVVLPGGPLPASVEPPGCHYSEGGTSMTCDSIVDAICFEYEQQQMENPQCDGHFEFSDDRRGSGFVRIRLQQGKPVEMEVDRGPLQQVLAERQRSQAPFGLVVRLDRGQRPLVLGDVRVTGAARGRDGAIRYQISDGAAPVRRR